MAGESLGSILRRIKAQRDVEGAEPAHTPATESPDRPQEPTCPACNDRGWLTPSVPVGHPDFGKPQPCTCQQQLLEDDRLRRLRLYSNLGHMVRFTFESIEEERVDPDNADPFRIALNAALAYAQMPSGWLVFDGPPGTGKTHLAASIANSLITLGLPVLFVSASDLLDELRSGYAPDNPMPFSEIFQRVAEAEVLVLDALGSHSTTPWAQEKLHQLLNHRFNTMLPTVVTLSCPMEDLDPHLRVRLLEAPNSHIVSTGKKTTDTDGYGVGSPHASALERMGFNTFQTHGTTHEQNELMAAQQAARAFADSPHGWLVLCGPHGVGKTHLAVAITAELSNSHHVYFARVQQLMYRLQSSFQSTGDSQQTFDTLFRAAADAEVLILDDLGAENDSEWSRATLHELLSHRYEARLPTVVTTFIDMTRQSGAIASRLCDSSISRVIHMSAPDYRRAPPTG